MGVGGVVCVSVVSPLSRLSCQRTLVYEREKAAREKEEELEEGGITGHRSM